MQNALGNGEVEALARIQCTLEGIDAAQDGKIVPVAQMFNPLSSVASPSNPRSPAFAEPAAIDFAEIIGRISMKSPLLAEHLFKAVGDILAKLQYSSELGRSGQFPDTREIQLYNDLMTLVFLVDKEASVIVVAVYFRDDALK